MPPFWKPPAPQLASGYELPPRKLNLSELREVGEYLAKSVGGDWYLRSSWADEPDVRYTLGDLEDMSPDRRAYVVMQATAPPPSRADQVRPQIAIMLSMPPTLSLQLDPTQEHRVRSGLLEKWGRFGRPARHSGWIYPASFILALAAALAGALVLWIRVPISLWLAPAVLLGLAGCYGAGAQWVMRRMQRYQARHPDLPIDFGTMAQVRERRATTWAKWTDLAWGFGTGVVLTLIGVLLKVR